MDALPEVLGQKFDSYLTETGEVVFSQSSVARGLGIRESSARGMLANNSLKAIQGKEKALAKLRVRTGDSINHISVVTRTLLTGLVSYLAERGHDRAASMQQASFAIMLQQSVDVAYGTTRESREYTEAASRP